MTADGIERTTICFTKGSTTLKKIDKIRGNMSRSKAIRRLLDYQVDAGEDYIQGVLGVKPNT